MNGITTTPIQPVASKSFLDFLGYYQDPEVALHQIEGKTIIKAEMVSPYAFQFLFADGSTLRISGNSLSVNHKKKSA